MVGVILYNIKSILSSLYYLISYLVARFDNEIDDIKCQNGSLDHYYIIVIH